MLFLGNGLRVVAATAAVAIAAPLFADAPAMMLTVSAGSFGKTLNIGPNSTSSTGIGSYFGAVSGSNGLNPLWNCNYNFSAASGADFATQTGSISLTNTSGEDLAFAMTLALPTAALDPMSGQYNGSVSAALITGSASAGAGTMSQSAEHPLWVVRSGTVQVASLLGGWGPVTRSTAGASLVGSASFGGATPSQPGESFGDPLSVTFYFMLSSNATATFTTSVNGIGTPVPAPGALALLATAGLVARRRRR